jgi:hypothetical protein
MVINRSITKRFRYFPILLFIPSILYAQQDSLNIRQKILASEESDQMFIQRTRNFIFDKLKTAEITEAEEAYNFVVNKYESEVTKPFWIEEKFLLGYWFGKYEILFRADSIENSMYLDRNAHWISNREYLYPQPDKLALELGSISYKHKAELMKRLDSLVHDREKYDYLVLFFDWITFDAADPERTGQEAQDDLEKYLTPRAEEFLSTYKISIFRSFVQRHFRYKYVLNDWGYGYCFGLGSLIPDGTAEHYLKPEIILGMDLELSWKSLLIDLGFDMGFPESIRKSFIYKHKIWNTNVRYNYYTYYIGPGWVVQETKYYKIIPHIGIGGINMSVCEGDKVKAGGEFSLTQTAIQYGITCDLKLNRNNSFYKENHHSYSGVSVGLDYFKYFENNPVMSGGMLRFRISWIGFGRAIRRDM